MERNLPQAEYYSSKNRRRSAWKKVVSVLCCVVVFATTYALILPAITMEKQCELPEHVHDANCYTQVTEYQVRALSCPEPVHAHTDECGEFCGYADFVVHSHDDSCFDETGALVCTLPEVKVHTHDESCYATPEAAHKHADECYAVSRGALLCTVAEGDGAHTHGEDCYEQSELICGLEETAGHQHEDACYEAVSTLICEIPESDEEAEPVLICGEEEVVLHTHEDGCFEVYKDDE